jgi:hypothetical protein
VQGLAFGCWFSNLPKCDGVGKVHHFDRLTPVVYSDNGGLSLASANRIHVTHCETRTRDKKFDSLQNRTEINVAFRESLLGGQND